MTVAQATEKACINRMPILVTEAGRSSDAQGTMRHSMRFPSELMIKMRMAKPQPTKINVEMKD